MALFTIVKSVIKWLWKWDLKEPRQRSCEAAVRSGKRKNKIPDLKKSLMPNCPGGSSYGWDSERSRVQRAGRGHLWGLKGVHMLSAMHQRAFKYLNSENFTEILWISSTCWVDAVWSCSCMAYHIKTPSIPFLLGPLIPSFLNYVWVVCETF